MWTKRYGISFEAERGRVAHAQVGSARHNVNGFFEQSNKWWRSNMKTRANYLVAGLLGAALAVGVAVPALAASGNKLDAEVRDLTDYFETVQKDRTKAVPAQILSKAEGIIIMRNYKAGFIIGAAGGVGCHHGQEHDYEQMGPGGLPQGW
jgi:hypothetical protein